MYIFEFSHTLKQQDLVDIWQNLAPRQSLKDEGFEISESTIEHELFANSFLGLLPNNSELRWEVFKVKQKAKTNYFENVLKYGGGMELIADKNVGSADFSPISPGAAEIPDYSFNWPYDYFSIVELVKMEAEMIFERGGPERTEATRTSPPSTEIVEVDPDNPLVQAVVTGDAIGAAMGGVLGSVVEALTPNNGGQKKAKPGAAKGSTPDPPSSNKKTTTSSNKKTDPFTVGKKSGDPSGTQSGRGGSGNKGGTNKFGVGKDSGKTTSFGVQGTDPSPSKGKGGKSSGGKGSGGKGGLDFNTNGSTKK
mgnify:CR=1 FL=1